MNAEDQKRLFWKSHRELANSNLLKARDIAQANYSASVARWRESGSDESRWGEFTAEASHLLDIAEQNLISL